MSERHRRRRSCEREWGRCRGHNTVTHKHIQIWDGRTTTFDWPAIWPVNGQDAIAEENPDQVPEDTLRSVEAAFILSRGDSKELLDQPSVGGLAWVMYRILSGDPKWDAAATIEALRDAVKKLYRNHVVP